MHYVSVSIIIVGAVLTRSGFCVPPPRCCPGDNLVEAGRCSDGSNISLSCPARYPLKKENDSVFQEDGGVLLNGDYIGPTEYCFTKSKKRDVELYVICAEDESIRDTKLLIISILGFISVTFILVTIRIYLAVPSLLDLLGQCIVQSILGLGIFYFSLSMIQLISDVSEEVCTLTGFAIYTSFLYAFFWLNILSFHIWRTIVNPKILRSIKRWNILYYAFGIGGTFGLLSLLVVAHFGGLPAFEDIHPGIGHTSCWFKSMRETFIYFYGPIAILICINIVYYIWTVIVLCNQLKYTCTQRTKILKYRFKLCTQLFFIMGICWIFEVISAAVDQNRATFNIWIVTDVINSLQGFFIFLLLVVLRKKVIRGLAERKCCYTRLPARWRNVKDEECEETEQETNLPLEQLPREPTI